MRTRFVGLVGRFVLSLLDAAVKTTLLLPKLYARPHFKRFHCFRRYADLKPPVPSPLRPCACLLLDPLPLSF